MCIYIDSFSYKNLLLKLDKDVQKNGFENFVFDTKEERKGNIKSLTFDELEEIDGGFLPTLWAIGGVATVCVAIYEAGKVVGEFIYYATH